MSSVDDISLEVNGHLKEGERNWSVAQLKEWKEDAVNVVVKMNEDELNSLVLKVPIQFIQN